MLETKIKQHIQQHGAVSIATFMEMALSDPKYGYYTNQAPLGAAGDFITAPEISQLFGELIGIWIVLTWEQLGKPTDFILVELGAGKGTLLQDALRIIGKHASCLQAASIHIVDINPSLKAQQKQALHDYNITWHDHINDLPEKPFLLIANEFLDALPISQFEQQENGQWLERVVALDADENLCFQTQETTKTIPQTASDFYEVSPASLDCVSYIAERCKTTNSAALLIDYGYQLQADQAGKDTLQALKQHNMVSPLEHIGEADITAHVDFQAMINCAEENGTAAFGTTTQADLLTRLGIEMRQLQLLKANPEKQEMLQAAYTRLMSPEQMGTLFKAITIMPHGSNKPIGF